MSEADGIAGRIVDRIIEDLSDRRGLRQEWDLIDDDIKKEIRDEWVRITEETK